MKKRILFLADRNALIDQTRRGDFKHFKDKMTVVKHRQVDKSYEIYLSLYQGISGNEEDKNIFSVIFIDKPLMRIFNEIFEEGILHQVRDKSFRHHLVEVIIVFPYLFFLQFERDLIPLLKYVIGWKEIGIITGIQVAGGQYDLVESHEILTGLKLDFSQEIFMIVAGDPKPVNYH